jgi:hypothetical protein
MRLVVMVAITSNSPVDWLFGDGISFYTRDL